MNTPNLRDFQPTASQAKNVDNTKMLDTEADEPKETVTGTNTNKEYVTDTPKFGPLGATGRAG